MGRRQRAAIVVLGALVLSVAAACGGGDDEPSRDGAAAEPCQAEIADPPLTRGGDRAAVAEVVDDVQEGLVMCNGTSVCLELSDTAQRQVVGGRGDLQACGDAVDEAIERWLAAGEEPVLSPIEAIEIEGDEAFVTLDVPGRGRHRVRVVKASSWEMPALDLEHPPGFELLDE